MSESADLTKEEILTEYYQKFYHSNLYGNRCQSIGTRYFDYRLEKSWLKSSETPERLLEVGFASGEHMSKTRVFPKLEYVGLDINEPATQQYIEKINPELRSRLRFVKSNSESMPFQQNTFDRIVSTCLLHHVKEPLKVLQEIRRFSKNNAQIAIGLPADPGLLNRLIKNLITYPSLRKLGVDNPRLIYALEHPNQIGGLIALAKHVFQDDTVKVIYSPFRFPTWNLNLMVVVHIKLNKA
jgi:ubiquinone/menaquinone biosynthesis C-methylase UbiE